MPKPLPRVMKKRPPEVTTPRFSGSAVACTVCSTTWTTPPRPKPSSTSIPLSSRVEVCSSMSPNRPRATTPTVALASSTGLNRPSRVISLPEVNITTSTPPAIGASRRPAPSGVTPRVICRYVTT